MILSPLLLNGWYKSTIILPKPVILSRSNVGLRVSLAFPKGFIPQLCYYFAPLPSFKSANLGTSTLYDMKVDRIKLDMPGALSPQLRKSPDGQSTASNTLLC